jgi:choline dehydrogenase-like flavoprotein
MIIDVAKGSPGPVTADVCVMGGGVAGITVALRLATKGYRVALIEAGPAAPSTASQEFYKGENVGTENLRVDETRLRALGGSSNHWGGWCRELDAYDFNRTDLSGRGWPISSSDLAPYLDQAAAILGVSSATGADLPLASSDENLQTIQMYFAVPPTRFGERYGAALSATPNVGVFLNAAVTSAERDADTGRIAAVTARSLAGGSLTCRARFFVLAFGTVENIRTLLLWNRLNGGLISPSDDLGRYYMQHLHQALGEFATIDGATPLPPSNSPGNPTVFLASTEKVLREKGLGAFRLYSAEINCDALVDSLRGVVSGAFCSAVTGGGRLLATCEQRPNRDSRISLAAVDDAFGQSRVRLDWEIDTGDAHTLLEAGLEFGRYLIRSGLGRLRINPDVLAGGEPLRGWTALPSAPGAAGHQLGGARMSREPSDGVTDSNCRLWATGNLYIAGGAVFRTSGHANPTLTITQLALRLSDELDRRLMTG